MLNERMIAILKMNGYDTVESMLDIELPEEGYEEYIVEFEGCEYIVATEEEAEELAKESIMNLIDDIGLQSFSESFQSWIIDNCVDSEWFEDALQEHYESYVEDIKYEGGRLEEEMEEAGVETEEEYVEYLVDSVDDVVDYWRFNCGDDWVNEVVNQHNLIDWDQAVEECISIDGIALQLASYDHEENEEKIDGETYYIYRTN